VTDNERWLRSLPNYPAMAKRMGEYRDYRKYVGATDDWKSKLIPRSFYGVDINVCAYIHDYYYTIGGDQEDRFKADAIFLADMMRMIEMSEDSWWIMNWYRVHLARNMALNYFEVVRSQGKKSWNYIEKIEKVKVIEMEKVQWMG